MTAKPDAAYVTLAQECEDRLDALEDLAKQQEFGQQEDFLDEVRLAMARAAAALREAGKDRERLTMIEAEAAKIRNTWCVNGGQELWNFALEANRALADFVIFVSRVRDEPECKSAGEVDPPMQATNPAVTL